MLEIDVYVGRFVAFGRDEALEQHFRQVRVHVGNAEAIADHRIGSGAAPLAKDAGLLRTGEAHDVVHGEEIARVVFQGDDRKLVPDKVRHFLRDALGIAAGSAFPGKALQFGLRVDAFLGRLFGIIVAELAEGKCQLAREMDGLGKRFRMVPEQPRHLGRRLHMPFGIRPEFETGIRDGHVRRRG